MGLAHSATVILCFSISQNKVQLSTEEKKAGKKLCGYDSSLLNFPREARCAISCLSRACFLARVSSSMTWIGNHSGRVSQLLIFSSVKFSCNLSTWGRSSRETKSIKVPPAANKIAYRIAPSCPPEK